MPMPQRGPYGTLVPGVGGIAPFSNIAQRPIPIPEGGYKMKVEKCKAGFLSKTCFIPADVKPVISEKFYTGLVKELQLEQTQYVPLILSCANAISHEFGCLLLLGRRQVIDLSASDILKTYQHGGKTYVLTFRSIVVGRNANSDLHIFKDERVPYAVIVSDEFKSIAEKYLSPGEHFVKQLTL